MFSSVLSRDDGTNNNKTQKSDERLNFCGANFCPSGLLNLSDSISNVTEISDGPILERPSTDQIRFLMYIFLGLSILSSIIVAIFFNPAIPQYE